MESLSKKEVLILLFKFIEKIDILSILNSFYIFNSSPPIKKLAKGKVSVESLLISRGWVIEVMNLLQ